MIKQKTPQPTRTEEKAAYLAATMRDGGCCVRCGAADAPTRDHRKNRSQGGQTTTANLQILGGTGTTGCHGWVTSHPAEAIAEGWAVPSWAAPAEWPARRWVTGALSWVLYDDVGGIEVITEAEAARRMNPDGVIC